MKLKKLTSKIWEIKKNVKVKDIMSKKSFSLDKDKKVTEAVKLMAEKSISAIVILDGKKPIGIVTERDLIKKVMLEKKDQNKLKISEIMSKNPKKIGPNSTILNASRVMKKLNVRKLVVVDKEGNILGMLSQTDIIQSMNKVYESYRSLLWNPTFSFWILIVVLILYLISFMLKIYLR